MPNLSYFDKTVVLNVDKRYKSQEYISSELNRHGVKNLSFFVVGDGQILEKDKYDKVNEQPSTAWLNGGFSKLHNSYNAFLSYKDIIKQAKSEGVKNLLLFEDDIEFRANSEALLHITLNMFIKNMLPAFDLLYLGANHTWAKTKIITPNILQVFGSVCWHAIAVNERLFDEILTWPIEKPIDDKAKELHWKYNCYAIWPSIVIQKPGFSNVEGRFVDYSQYWSNIGEDTHE